MKKKFLFAKTWMEYAGFLLVRSIARFLPYAWAGGLGAALGGFVFRCTRIRKRVTMENLSRAFPEKAESEIIRIAHGAFRNYGRTILEMFWEWSASTERIRSIVHLINPEIARNALRDHKGVIILSGHFGSWELLLASSYFTLGLPMTAIVQRQRNRKIDAIVDKNRSRFELRTVEMGQSVREALLCLKAGGVLFLLGDQSGSKESLYVPFFGRPAATHRGPAAFALKTGAHLVMEFLIRREDGEYDVYFEEVDHSDLKGSTEEHIIELTRRHTEMLERSIRAHPDLWLWMHKRWKHTPYYEAKLREQTHASDRTTV